VRTYGPRVGALRDTSTVDYKRDGCTRGCEWWEEVGGSGEGVCGRGGGGW